MGDWDDMLERGTPGPLADEGSAESVWKDLLNCQCSDKFVIEPHGKGYALYWGRCQHRHGYNLLHITECTREDILKLIEKRLNEKGADNAFSI